MGCGCISAGLHACTTAPITERKQLKLISESQLNAQAAKAYEQVKKKAKLSDDKESLNKIIEIGSKIVSVINQLKKEVRYIKSIRGLGAMQGIEIVDKNGDPDKDRVLKIHQHALQNGLVMITAGTFGNVIRTLMPLTISNAELNQSLDILCDALKNS